MNLTTPEHLVRIEWARTRMSAVCVFPRCDWTASIGYPDLSGPLNEATRLQLHRQATQLAAMHGHPDLHWPTPGGCDCQPDHTTDPRFWNRIRPLAKGDAR